MSDCISREAAVETINELLKSPYANSEDMFSCGVRDALKLVRDALLGKCPESWRIPAADVVEVVRCIDCINWNGNDCVTMYGLFAPKPKDYCARGHRRVDDG